MADKEENKTRTFTVSYRIDGRIDLTVEAESAEDAFKKAETEFQNADINFNLMDIVESGPVNAYDEATGKLTDYNG